MRGLSGNVAVITGATGGIGVETVRRFVQEGCKVTAIDRDAPTEALCNEFGDQVLFIQADISSEEQIEAAAKQSKERFGNAKFLINNAAVFPYGSYDAPMENYELVCKVNIMGTSIVTKYFVPQIIESNGGSVVNLSSISGIVGQPAFGPYNASKFAIRGLTRVWAIDLAKHNIRVNSVCPGHIRTIAFDNYCIKFGLDIAEEDRRVAGLHLLNRQGEPDEVSGVIAFLCSDDASFMTGSDVLVEGGYLAR